MSRESESPDEFGLVGAGPAATSLAGTLARTPGALGPVVGVSYRVASRIANSLGAGRPARDASELRSVDLILFHAPPPQMEVLAELLAVAGLDWSRKQLVFIDCEAGPVHALPMSAASFAWIRKCPIPGRLAVGGDGTALTAAARLAATRDRRPITVPNSMKSSFDAAMLLGGAALVPLIDSVAHILRQTGLADKESTLTAVSLFQATVQGYGRSGRQSWEWHVHPPDVEEIERQIAALGAAEARILRDLLLLGFERFRKHGDAAATIRDSITANYDPPDSAYDEDRE